MTAGPDTSVRQRPAAGGELDAEPGTAGLDTVGIVMTAPADPDEAADPDPDAADAAESSMAVEPDVLAGGVDGVTAVAALTSAGLADYGRAAAARGGPLPAGGPTAVAAQVRSALGAGRLLPEKGVGAESAVRELATLLGHGSADPAHPHCAAHLHCPPLAVAAAADLLASVANASLDSWDQAPAASGIEDEVLATLVELAGLPSTASGTLTTGGSEANLLGLLLARDAALRDRFDVDPAIDGIPREAAGRLRVLCSRAAHFSVARAAAALGLGERAVLPVGTDAVGRMDPLHARTALVAARRRGDVPIALVATAGSTDTGAIDPLPELAALAAPAGAWLHVDAAYGGGLLFSPASAPLLDGLAAADSVGLDLHKLGWQPIAAGVFLVRDAAELRTLARRVAYLNPLDDEAAGYPNLLGRSLRTTRRADAVKIAATFRALGRAGLAALVERCRELAGHVACRIDQHPALRLAAQPQLTTLLFRYQPKDPARVNAVNAGLRRRLLAAGTAVIGRADLPAVDAGTHADNDHRDHRGVPGVHGVHGDDRGAGRAGRAGGADDGAHGGAAYPRGSAAPQVWLKLTLLNPTTTPAQLDALLDAVVAAGRQEENA